MVFYYYGKRFFFNCKFIFCFFNLFLFFRFFNPAIVTPESFDILPNDITPDKQDRQNFIAITRILQVCIFIIQQNFVFERE